MSAKLLYEQQPMKLAAAEGLERDTAGAALTVAPGIEMPKRAQLPVHQRPDATVQGTEDLQARFEERFGPGDYRPNQASSSGRSA